MIHDIFNWMADMIKTLSSRLAELQSKPKRERQVTYFCRLCRNYAIKARKAHLKNYHNADPDTISKRSMDDIVDVIFLPNG